MEQNFHDIWHSDNVWPTPPSQETNISLCFRFQIVQVRDENLMRVVGSFRYQYSSGRDVDFADFFADYTSTGVCGGGEVVLFEEAGVYQMGEVFPLGILKGEGQGGSPGFFKDVLGLHPEQMEKLFKLELLF